MEIMLRAVAILGLFTVAMFLLLIIWAIASVMSKERKKQRIMQEINAALKEVLEEKKESKK